MEILKILGIDPGTTVTGYGLVEIRNKKPVILEKGKIYPEKRIVTLRPPESFAPGVP